MLSNYHTKPNVRLDNARMSDSLIKRTLCVANMSLPPSSFAVPPVNADAAVLEPLLEPSSDLLFDPFRLLALPPCGGANDEADAILLRLRSRPRAPPPPLLDRRSTPLPLSSPLSSSSSLMAAFSLRSAFESIVSMFTVPLKSWRYAKFLSAAPAPNVKCPVLYMTIEYKRILSIETYASNAKVGLGRHLYKKIDICPESRMVSENDNYFTNRPCSC